MTTSVPFHEDRGEREARVIQRAREKGLPRPASHCWVCGNAVDPKHDQVIIYEASCYLALDTRDAVQWPIENNYWELGVCTVGPECAKKLGKANVFTHAEARRLLTESRAAWEAHKATAAKGAA